ncbi:MAG: phosphate acyltransferase PlsX [Chloroflexi bacterium]|nr:phosphate acyltransferase PlsX [Chloroflexota bacterium]
MRIVVDAMGGDDAPEVVIQGLQAYLAQGTADVILVGQEDKVKPLLENYPLPPDRVQFRHASQVIDMDEHPAEAVKAKEDSSMVVGMNLLKSGEADAFMSAGNSGGVLAAALFRLGRIPGIKRPALSTVFPTQKGFTFILDIGANTDCKPLYLQQFGIMGSIYAERVLGVPNPRVGIVSNGEEPGKGSMLVQEAFGLLKGSNLNFIGNVEGKDIPAGMADVVVTDGFTGNVIIKLAEGAAALMLGIIGEEIRRRKVAALGALLAKPAFRAVKHRLDYAEYGGAPLLGVDGVVIIAHGRSNAKAICNAIRVAERAVNGKIVEQIKSGVAEQLGAGGEA